MHSRRGRPTLRVMREDLKVGWDSPQPQRWLGDGALVNLQPLSDLPHPLIARAARFVVVDALHEHAAHLYEHHGFRRIPNTLRLVQKVSDVARAIE